VARVVSRAVAAVIASGLVVSGLEVSQAQAGVAPPSLATVHGFLTTVSTSDPDLLVVNYTVTVQGQALTAAQLTTTTFASAPVDPATVQIDGVTAPSATVTRTSTKMTVRLGTGADAGNGGSLGVGSYLVSYQQQRPTGVSPNASTTATLNFNRGGIPGSTTSNTVALEHPDITLTIPRGSGEDKAALLGTGRTVGYAAYLRNRGATADAATLTLSLPTGLRVDTLEGIVRLDLSSGGDGNESLVKCKNQLTPTVTCTLGQVTHGTESVLLVPLVATRTAKPGTRGAFHLTVTPNGEPDQNPGDNSLSARVKFTGIARLKATLISPVTKVAVGSKVTVKVRIKNLGPQPARYGYGIVSTGSRHFVISKFITKRRPTSGPRTVREPAPPEYGDVLEWNVGTIGAHSTAYARMVLTAKSAGKSLVEFLSGSAAGDPACDSGFGKCRALASLKLVAVKKQPGADAAKVDRV
jgi:hypothetical protein